MEHVWLDVATLYGSTTVQVAKKHYQRAVNAPKNLKTNSRDTICIRIREKLNASGANIDYLEWGELRFTSIRTQEPAEVKQTDVETPEEFFSYNAPDRGNYKGENPCGCVP